MKKQFSIILSIIAIFVVLSSPAAALSEKVKEPLNGETYSELFRSDSPFNLSVEVVNDDLNDGGIEVRLERGSGEAIGAAQTIPPGTSASWAVPSGVYAVEARAVDVDASYVVSVREKPRVGWLVFAGALLLAAAAALLLWAARKRRA